MIPAPPGYAAALARSHGRSSDASVLSDGKVVRDNIPIIGGKVIADRSGSVRRSCDVSFIPDLELLELLLPYGNELQVWSTVHIPAGRETPPALARFSLGVFRTANPRSSDDGASPSMTVTGYDRSRAIRRNRFTAPYTVAKSTNYVTAIGALMQNRLPAIRDVDLDLPDVDELSPLLVFDAQSDPWDALSKMATAIGMEVFFDVDGLPVLQAEPDPEADPPVWTFAEGDGSTLLSVDRNISDDPGYNGVLCAGESTSAAAPVQALVWDGDPKSKTYYLGPYGQVPVFMTTQYVTTVAQAQSAARAELRRQLGVTEAASVTAIPNPALELGDTCLTVREPVGLNGRQLVERIEMPLVVDEAMTVGLRERRAVIDA